RQRDKQPGPPGGWGRRLAEGEGGKTISEHGPEWRELPPRRHRGIGRLAPGDREPGRPEDQGGAGSLKPRSSIEPLPQEHCEDKKRLEDQEKGKVVERVQTERGAQDKDNPQHTSRTGLPASSGLRKQTP